jgi:pyruvate/2-oxoglutarate dehydrogenase complex dihydrolipoamide acyltransferase (E2) component
MAKVSGYVKEINVDTGDHVRQGQALAMIEMPEMQDDAARAQLPLNGHCRYGFEMKFGGRSPLMKSLCCLISAWREWSRNVQAWLHNRKSTMLTAATW